MTDTVRKDARGPEGPLTLERVRADIASTLQMAPHEIPLDENLLDLGLDSIRLMILVDRWSKAGAVVDFGALAEKATAQHWWTLVSRALEKGGSVSA